MEFLNGKNSPEYWSSLVDHLKDELDAESKLSRRAGLQCSLACVLGEKLGDSEEAFKYVDAAVEAAPVFPDVLWQAWRAAVRRDAQKRLSVLEYLFAVLEKPEDLVSCLVRQASLCAAYPDKIEDAMEYSKNALETLPNHRGALWCAIETSIQSGYPERALPHIEKISQTTADPALKAALIAEKARIMQSVGADRESVLAVLQDLLSQPCADWSMVNEALRTARSFDAWHLCDKALEKLADAALENEPEKRTDRPAGYAFTGFLRGAEAAAAYLWLSASLREKKLNLPEYALESLEKAAALVPDNRFLQLERPRLLCAMGRPADALQAMPDLAESNWKIETALAAGRPDLAMSLLLSERESGRSIFREVMREMANEADETAPISGEEMENLSTWFLAHPSHPDALGIAKKAIDLGGNIPVLALAVEEGEPHHDALEWPPAADSDDDARWRKAVKAILGSVGRTVEEQAQAYLSWADGSADPKLQAELIATAARIYERESDSTRASEQMLSLYQRAVDLDPDHPYAGRAVLKLLRSMGRWADLTSRLADLASTGADQGKISEALYEQAFVCEHALLDPDRAGGIYAEIAARYPSDAVAAWSSVLAASRNRDWPAAVRHLDRMIEICPEDAHLLHLLSGEINFLALGNSEEALAHFETAGNGPDRIVAKAARILRIFSLHKTGDLASLDAAVQEEALESEKESASAKRLLLLAFGADSLDPIAAAENLRKLAGTIPQGAMADACKTAAAILDGGQPANTSRDGGSDIKAYSEELLWHTADRLTPHDDLVFRANISKLMAESSFDENPLEYADWMLCRAESMERFGDANGAFETIAVAMEKAPKHLGLLHAKMRVAAVLGLDLELVDAYKKLADIYASPEKKAEIMAAAAAILIDRLGDEEDAEKFCRTALSHSKTNAEANEILSRILRNRGDNRGLASLIQQRIVSEGNTKQLVELYQEQIAQLIELEDYNGALEAVDKLISIDPERLPPLLTKVGLLYEVKRWDEALSAMDLYTGKIDDPVEIRSMTWRMADLLADQIGRSDEAMEMLAKLVDLGERHPETERKLIGIAMRTGRWEKAADALGRLAELTEDPKSRAEAKREEARIRLQHLFDDEGAEKAIEEALSCAPSDLDAIRFSLEFRSKEAVNRSLEKAVEEVRNGLASNPVDSNLISDLREISILREQREIASLCDDAISALSGAPAPSLPGEIVPFVYPDANKILGLVTHPNERCAASIVAKTAAGMAADVFNIEEYLPAVSKTTAVPPLNNDPLCNWIKAWARLIGLTDVEIHRAGADPYGAVALTGEVPAIAVNPSVHLPLKASQRFYIARSLWRSYRGLGVFPEGDSTGPVRWVLALASVVLGEKAELPMPTDRDIVLRAQKVMPRKLKRSLIEPCELLLSEGRHVLRNWSAAISFSADRFGLLAARQLQEVLPLMVEECAGPSGLKRLAENAAGTYSKIPRCREIIGFSLSEDHVEARRSAEPGIRREEGGR